MTIGQFSIERIRVAGILVALLLLSACSAVPPDRVRQPVRMGTWYTDDPQRLGSYIDAVINKAVQNPIRVARVSKICSQNPDVKQNVIALICPHVAYRFSGEAVAHAFATVRGQKFNRVFILGPKHQGYVPNAVLPTAAAFATPFGSLPVDTQVVKKLAGSPGFTIDERPHNEEFSIEMQLPFLRHMFGEVKIVPIIVGICTTETEHSIADSLLKVISPGDLVIVSSDFTQYGAMFDYQPFRNNVADNIQNLDRQAYSYVSHLDAEGLMNFKQTSGDPICGIASIYILLNMLPPKSTATLLDYYTSRDVKIDDGQQRNRRNWSVSYVAVAFSGANWGDKTPIGNSAEGPATHGSGSEHR